MTAADARGRGQDGGLSNAFHALKRRGPQILVTGDVPETVSQRASRRLLGHPEEKRHRVLVLTDSSDGAERWLPHGVSPDSDGAEVVRAGIQRSASASSSSPASSSTGPPGTGQNQLPYERETVARETQRAVEAWRRDRDVPPPSQLRVGLYSLGTLIEQEGLDAVRPLLCLVTGSVRWARGMGHYHLPREPGSDPVVDLQYVFDARLDLRTGGDGAEQRWHLPGTGTTGWVGLDEDL